MAPKANRAVFLDRDGVLNEPILRDGRPYPPMTVGQLRLTPGAADAIRALKDAGFLLIVVTNQPDVARGTQTQEAVGAINAAIAALLPVDEFAVCWHDDADGCHCRKPRPGLLLDSALRHRIDLASSYLIGDRWRDIDAGVAAGCRTILIDRHYQERAPEHSPDFRAESIVAAAGWILMHQRQIG
jgi:D-glycero-D-manno-heptose 1,7-bisphosphate phosphatase